MPDYSTLADGCEGDSAGLAAALGTDFVVLYENYDHEGWGHHGADAVFKASDGRFVHAECGGCSCGGRGSWDYCADEQEALRLIPEHARPESL
jgi:hypothetical protein